MKTKELKNLSVSQLEKELSNFKKEKFNLRIQKMNSQITNSARITIALTSSLLSPQLRGCVGR